MKNRGAESPAVVSARRARHEEYLAAGWVMMLGLNGRMKRRMVRTGIVRHEN